MSEHPEHETTIITEAESGEILKLTSLSNNFDDDDIDNLEMSKNKTSGGVPEHAPELDDSMNKSNTKVKHSSADVVVPGTAVAVQGNGVALEHAEEVDRKEDRPSIVGSQRIGMIDDDNDELLDPSRDHGVDVASAAGYGLTDSEARLHGQPLPSAYTVGDPNDQGLGGSPAVTADAAIATANPVEQADLEQEFRNSINPVVAEEGKEGNRRTRFILLVLLALVLIVAGVVIGVVLSTQASGTSATESPTMAPTTPAPTTTPSVTPTLSQDGSVLLNFLVDSGSITLANGNRETPQFRAFLWLTEDIAARRERGEVDLSDQRLLQRYALATLFYSTGGPSEWLDRRGFLTPKDEWEWGCSNPNGGCSATAGHLRLVDNGLNGELPRDELPFLSEMMRSLDLSNNALVGTLPEGLFSLSNLVICSLSFNEGLSGTIPEAIVGWTSIRRIYFDTCPSENSCGLTGPLPTNLGTLRTLVELSISQNNFQSTIITEIGQLRRLERLRIDSSSLTGQIPTEIGMLESLEELILPRNEMFTSIPTEIGMLTLLRRVDLSQRTLQGTLPSEIGNLKFLNRLGLVLRGEEPFAPTTLGGRIPTELFAATRLETLELGHVQFTGTLPTEVGQLTELGIFRVDFWSSPGFASPIPSELGLCRKLRSITGHRSNFMGTIPSEIGQLDQIFDFAFFRGATHLTGTLPSELGNCSSMGGLNLEMNEITGTLPTEFGSWPAVTMIGIGRNNMTGTIPSEYGRLESLERLSLRDNEFTGSLPEELAKLTRLVDIQFENNKFNGTLSTSLGLLTSLEGISIRDNTFSGTVPTELASLPLSFFTATRNDLTGTMPLCKLMEVDVRADCEEVVCPCCVRYQCCIDTEPCPRGGGGGPPPPGGGGGPPGGGGGGGRPPGGGGPSRFIRRSK